MAQIQLVWAIMVHLPDLPYKMGFRRCAFCNADPVKLQAQSCQASITTHYAFSEMDQVWWGSLDINTSQT